MSKARKIKPFQKISNSIKSNLRSENPRVGSSILSQATIFIDLGDSSESPFQFRGEIRGVFTQNSSLCQKTLFEFA